MKKLLSRKYMGFIMAGVAVVVVGALAFAPHVGWQLLVAYGIYTAGNVAAKFAGKEE